MRVKQHIKETIALSFPLIISQVGHIITSMTDNAFLGFVSLESQDAGILSGNIFILFLVFLIGMAQGLTPKIAEAHVNNRENVKAALLKNSMLLNLTVAAVLYLIVLVGMNFLELLDQPFDVIEMARPFLNIIALSLVPLSIFFTLKQYCEGLSNTRAAMYISLSGNILNIILNYLLIFGKFGFPDMGYLGAAWATFISRVFMAVAFVFYVFSESKLKTIRSYLEKEKVNKKDLKLLFKMGVGPAIQYIFEVAAFAIAGFMSGWLGKITFAAHGISLSIASFTYMFASGVSGASSIRVANFKGTGDTDNIKRAGIVGLSISAGFMLFFALCFILFNHLLPAFFSEIPEVIKLSSGLLLVAAVFQLFDGVQVTALGILRGLSDVKMPTFIAMLAYWGIALPVAYYLGFRQNAGVYGIWFGLTAGLMFSAVALTARIKYLTKSGV
ncbi:MAG: MATE family efflux transporter [Bacteroidia bacterium]